MPSFRLSISYACFSLLTSAFTLPSFRLCISYNCFSLWNSASVLPSFRLSIYIYIYYRLPVWFFELCFRVALYACLTDGSVLLHTPSSAYLIGMPPSPTEPRSCLTLFPLSVYLFRMPSSPTELFLCLTSFPSIYFVCLLRLWSSTSA